MFITVSGLESEFLIHGRKQPVLAYAAGYNDAMNTSPPTHVESNNPLPVEVCEQARLSRDARFDGLFYTAVKTTGIYCRPVCPAPPAKSGNVDYFTTAAAAAAAGYRPCLRCRPEIAPGSPHHHAASQLVRQSVSFIDQGYLDYGSMADLSARVGVGERHLRRLFATELGASPHQVAATRRLLFAKQLLSETAMAVTEVAMASGYQSLRRFNDAFRQAYGMNPSHLRKSLGHGNDAGSIQLRLTYRPPYDFAAVLDFMRLRLIAGVEEVIANSYSRLFVLAGQSGRLTVRQQAERNALLVEIQHPKPELLMTIMRRVRHLFDLDADSAVIDDYLARHNPLAELVGRLPGTRVPGCWDGLEIAVRAVLGQQVSVVAATTFTQRLVALCGQSETANNNVESRALFPSASQIAAADLSQIGITRQRQRTLRALARSVEDGVVTFEAHQALDDFVAAWCEIPGIGPWTAHYIAMRVLHHPDAFPAADLVLRKALGDSQPVTEKQLRMLSQQWRPWRAYAVMLLWRGQSEA